MTNYTIPRANAPIAGQEAPTIQWYNYLRGIGASSTASNAALMADITIISDKLGSPDGTPENIPMLSNITDIQGISSVYVTGANIKQISLVNDAGLVSPVSLYGTNSSGLKGWHLVADAFADSANIGKTVTAGIVSFDLVDITPTAGGTLSLLSFDAKGRRTETDAASTSNLPEGANLYFTDARAQDATGAAIAAGTQTGITVTYNSGSHSIDFAVAPADFATKVPVAYAATAALPANTYSNGTAGVGATLTGTANGPLAIDGVTLVTGSAGLRVLVTAEASSANNGWYVVTQVGVIAVSPYILTRSTDADTGTEIGPGYLTVVEAPSALTPGTNNGKVFISVAPVPFVVGTDTLLFSAVGSAGGVSSVFGRTGVVVAATGDYTFSQIGSTPTTLAGYGITDAVSTSRAISTTAPLTGGGDLSANRTLAIPASTSSVNGYLDHADWTTFNGKLSDAPNDGNTYARNSATWTEIAASIANTNGFMIGNVLVQTGSDSAPIPSSSHETSKAVTFPVPYGTCLYAHAIPTVRSVTSSGFSAVSSTLSKSGTGFTANFDSDSGGVAGAYINTIIDFDWIAVGIFVGYGTLALTGTYPAGTVGTPYSQTLAISGGLSPYTLTGGTGIASGSLPAGLSLSISGSTLVLSGTPTTAATSTFTVSVDSTDAQTATSPQSVAVSASVDPTALSIYNKMIISGSPSGAYWDLTEVSGDRADGVGTSTMADYTPHPIASNAGLRGGADVAADFTAATSINGYKGLSCTYLAGDPLDIPSGGGNHCLFGWVNLRATGKAIAGAWDAVSSATLKCTIDCISGLRGINGSSSYNIATTTAPALNTWAFVCVWRDSTDGKVRLSVNNGTPAVSSGASNPTSLGATFYLGSFLTSYRANMLMSRFGWIKGSFLTSTEITWLMNSGSGRNWSEIKALAGH